MNQPVTLAEAAVPVREHWAAQHAAGVIRSSTAQLYERHLDTFIRFAAAHASPPSSRSPRRWWRGGSPRRSALSPRAVGAGPGSVQRRRRNAADKVHCAPR